MKSEPPSSRAQRQITLPVRRVCSRPLSKQDKRTLSKPHSAMRTRLSRIGR